MSHALPSSLADVAEVHRKLPSLHEFFHPGGLLAGSSLAFEHRPGQYTMAREIERCLARHRHLIVEAGTGTGKTLAYLLAHTTAHGAVAACGLAGGADLPVTVFPFILRAVGLLGISSSSTPASTQIQVWRRLARDLPASVVDSISRVEPLSRIFELAEEILAGGVRGRVILDVRA